VSDFNPILSGGVLREGINPFLRAGDHDLERLSLDVLKLPAKAELPGRTERSEALAVILSGVLTASAGKAGRVSTRKKSPTTDGHFVWDSIGRRLSPAEGAAYSFYLPPGSCFTMWGEREATVALISARASEGPEIQLITPEKAEPPPRERWRLILGSAFAAESLVVAERAIPEGGSLSFRGAGNVCEAILYLRLFSTVPGAPAAADAAAQATAQAPASAPSPVPPPPLPAKLFGGGPLRGACGIPLPDGAAVGLARGSARGGFTVELEKGVSGYVLLALASGDRSACAGALAEG